MKLDEANKLVAENQHLLGTQTNEGQIDDIVVIPSETGLTFDLCTRIYWGVDYDDILIMYEDFIVVVIYDIDEWMLKGVMRVDNIKNIIQ